MPLRDLLGAVAIAPKTRFELVRRQPCIDDCRARPAWDVALRCSSRPAPIPSLQTLYRLSTRGRRASWS